MKVIARFVFLTCIGITVLAYALAYVAIFLRLILPGF